MDVVENVRSERLHLILVNKKNRFRALSIE